MLIHRRTVCIGLGAVAAIPTMTQALADSLEAQYIQSTLVLGASALAMSRVALQKAIRLSIKEFAEFEIAEQDTLANVLSAMKTDEITPDLKHSSDAAMRQNLDPESAQMLKKLTAADAGPAFEAAYVNEQIIGHQKLLVVHENYLSSGRIHPALNVAKLARAITKEHLQRLARLQEEFKQAKQ